MSLSFCYPRCSGLADGHPSAAEKFIECEGQSSCRARKMALACFFIDEGTACIRDSWQTRESKALAWALANTSCGGPAVLPPSDPAAPPSRSLCCHLCRQRRAKSTEA